MRSNIANILKRLTIPYGAREDQPRIVLATDDPLAVAAGQSAAQVFYWNRDRAVLQSIQYVPEADRLPGDPEARFRIAAYQAAGYELLADAFVVKVFPTGGVSTAVAGSDVLLSAVGPGGGRVAINAADWDGAPGRTDINASAIGLNGAVDMPDGATLARANVAGRTVCVNTANLYVDAGPGLSTASTAYVDMAGVSVECAKAYPSTESTFRLRLNIAIQATVPCVMRFAANVGTVGVGPGSDFSMGKLDISAANSTVTYSIERDIPNIGAGMRVVQLRWRVQGTSGGAVVFGADHSASLTVSEIGL